jgi:amino acid transporter
MTDTSQQQAEVAAENAQPGRFGTIAGVFMPTLLTILGVIMFLRAGWVIGQTGLLGGLLIISIAFAITAATGLSLSSITTNIRIGAGGAYSVISQSLGIEMGGSVGVPLYLSQVLATVMYIFGFREGWVWAFEQLGMADSLIANPLLVDLTLFGVLFTVAYISAGLAFKLQYFVAAIIAGSLVSVGVAAAEGSMTQDPVMWAQSIDAAGKNVLLTADFWTVFAVFFPAATGIMAGANMSGELEDPRRSIPVGTMAAIAVSYVIYMLLAYWLARSATPTQLQENYTIMIDKAAWGPAVVGGLLGATFSSALASIVGAPRILQALSHHGIIPKGDFLAETTSEGEPRKAMMVTGGLVLAALMLRDLNIVAPFITMFFMITYGVINIVVLIEQSLGLTSFRPQLKVPRIVPFVGAAGCIFAMFVINATISLVAIAVVVGFYGLLIRRHLQSPFADVRSGLFVAIAQWAAQKAADLPSQQQRAWKPNLLVPVQDPLELRGEYPFLQDLVNPTGYVDLMGIGPSEREEALEKALEEFAEDFRAQGVFSRWTVLETEDFSQGIVLGMEALKGSFFRPNMVFMKMPRTDEERERLTRVFSKAQDNQLGMVVLGMHPKVRMGSKKTINLWVHDRSPDMELVLRRSHLNLAILLAYTISRNWEAKINIVCSVRSDREPEEVRESLENLIDLARIPNPEVHLLDGDFRDNFKTAPRCDLDIMGLSDPPNYEQMQRAVEDTESSVLFVADSGQESALA